MVHLSGSCHGLRDKTANWARSQAFREGSGEQGSADGGEAAFR